MGLGERWLRLGLGSERCLVLNQGNGGCENYCSGWRMQGSVMRTRTKTPRTTTSIISLGHEDYFLSRSLRHYCH